MQTQEMRRPLWVWNTYEIISSSTTTTQLLSAAVQASVTDFYLYLDASHYEKYHELITQFNAASSAANIRVWALEGGSVYFSDADGPSHFYRNIENLIRFNDQAPPDGKFFGFSADLEPYAKGEWTSFHNGIKGSDLDATPGTGVWKGSQAADRAALMQDWVDIHHTAKAMLSVAGWPFAAAFPHWKCNYFGEPLQVRWPDEKAPLRRVMELLMESVDDYVVMSYHTDPQNASRRVGDEVEYATALRRMGREHRPRVFAAVETIQGVGASVSYGDHALKRSRAAVLRDVEAITATLRRYDAFGGVAIHAWSGWKKLPE
ncbi:hypothetical protein MYCFIDRAFT_174599 [Lecanosticta acicola]|uniref:Uncharacterized protein n=1 Tax=Lecanosticta acicola TaxID=111012 RepID=A0AAI8YW79_9PEZI|nr:hypothetical protein MYCFIDRAFT_174599 [Lecanosticta acicola]